MTNRYRSSCCCDDQQESVCFLGYGGVPKTKYLPKDTCHGRYSQDLTYGNFNRHDNWSFCAHDTEEQLVAVMERTGFKDFSEIAYVDTPSEECNCSCIESPDAGVNTTIESRDPVVVWYKDPSKMNYNDSRGGDIPDIFRGTIDNPRTYYWSHYNQWNISVSPGGYVGEGTRENTWPCGCPEHKYDRASGCRSDFFCRQGYFSWCGFNNEDEQVTWWPDEFGSRRYLTQSQIDMIGNPGTGGWRTSENGYVRGGPSRTSGGNCQTTDEGTKVGFAAVEGSPNKNMNSDYMFLRDIIHSGWGDDKLFPNYKIGGFLESAIYVYQDFSFGSCDEASGYPYGLYPLKDTFVGVFHREKWWEQYWNSISVQNVCPEGTCEFGDTEGCECGVTSDIYAASFAEGCRVPRYVVSQCAGVPLFSSEVVWKLDFGWETDQAVFDDRPDYSNLEITITVDGVEVTRNVSSLAAYVLACMRFGSSIHPDVTDYMEKVGILPPPINYGEERDYRIFKKRLPHHDVTNGGGSPAAGHCCVNLDAYGDILDFGLLACDCGIAGASFCGWTGDQEGGSAAGISTCWDVQDIDADFDGVPDGIECARFVCGYQPGDEYDSFLQEFADERYGGDTFTAAENLFACCDSSQSDKWLEECVTAAIIARSYRDSQCGPPTLCFDAPEVFCRNTLGGQFYAGTGCTGTVADTAITTCAEHYDDGKGSLCFTYVISGDGSGTRRIHCIETEQSTARTLMDGGLVLNTNFTNLLQRLGVNKNLIISTSTYGGSEEEVDLLIDEVNGLTDQDGIGTARIKFTQLGNCEPLCEFADQVGVTLNSRARVCDENNYIAGECPSDEAVKGDYPCCDNDNDLLNICLIGDDFYFYGRPGEWRPVCGGVLSTDSMNNFFPQNSQMASALKTSCPGQRCWTAQPFPTIQETERVEPISPCPANSNDGTCQGEGNGICLPLLTICGNGTPNTQDIPDEYGPGTKNDQWPGAYSDSKNGLNYDAVLDQLCRSENYSYTCFGAWYQGAITGLEFIGEGGCGSGDNQSDRRTRYRCASINNAFFLRVPPGIQHDPDFCKDYDVQYALHEQGQTGGGGSDNPEWEGEAGTPAILVYHNRVLDDFIQFYGGCTHLITQGDVDSKIGVLFGYPIPEESDGVTFERYNRVMQWDLFTGNPTQKPITDPDYDETIDTDPPKFWTGFADADNPIIRVDRNDGNPSNSSNPYEISITLNEDVTLDQTLSEFENVWWGIVDHEEAVKGNIVPIIDSEDGDFSYPRFSNRNSIWPTTSSQNRVKIKIKTQNPGDYPNGLRDYQWYHAPINREGPLPSAYKLNYPDCWATPLCCNTKLTQAIGPRVCDHWKADRIQGQPRGESECNFDLLPSNGSDLPDPICGTCPEGTYCCPYTSKDSEGNLGRCIPEDTYCCGCLAGQICEKNGDGVIQCVTEIDGIQRLDFTPDHRGVAWRTITSSGRLNHWKIDDGPKDSNDLSILRKSNPNATNSNEDAVKYLVDEYFEPRYQDGYRRFTLRGPMGMRTNSDGLNGSGVPSAIWSAGDPNLGTWNDKRNIGTVQSDGPVIEYPFTSTGNLVSEDSDAVIGNLQQSYINFLKPWIQSKKDAGDPIDFYIYSAYQPAFFDDGTPARGNLAIALYQDTDWKNDLDTDEGTKWRDRFPLPDFSNPAHVDFFDGEIDPWIDIGVTGFIIDAASNASSNSTTGAVNPVQRPPGFFDYFRNKGVNVLGEAVPLSDFGNDDGFGEGADINGNLYKETGFVGYYGGKSPEDNDGGNFWRNRWTNFFISPEDSEIHMNLVWRFAGSPGGFNSAYASGENPTSAGGFSDVVYDIEGMKAEIDEMTERGFVVSAAFGPYSSTSPVNEAPARQEILDYILQRNTQSTVFGGGINSSARVPFHVLNGDTESMHFLISFQMSAPDDNKPEDIEDYINKTDDEIRQGFQNHINGFDDRGSTPGVLRSEYLNENTTGYVMFDLEKPLNYGSIDNTQEELTWFTEGLIRRIQIFREFCPNAKICVWRLGNPDFRVGYSQFPNGGLNDIDFNTLLENSVFASKVEYNGESLYDAIDVYAPILYQYYAEGDEFAVAERILNGDRVEQIKTIKDRFLLEHGVDKPCIPIMKFEHIDIGVSDQNVTNGANADDINAPEIAKLLQDKVTKDIMFWLGGSWSDTFTFETKKDRLVDLINDIRSTPKDQTIIILDPRSGEPIDDTDAETLPSNEYGGYQ